jgi:hypothetical protein
MVMTVRTRDRTIDRGGGPAAVENGGWGAGDADNAHDYLNNLPSPITGRC